MGRIPVLTGIIIIVIVAIVFFGGALFCQKYYSPEQFSENQDVPSASKAINWEGNYRFKEFAPPDEEWIYNLNISSADGLWHLGLGINGFQTETRIIATANNVGDNLDIVFDSYGPGNATSRQFNKGDVLFTLTPSLSIKWKKMQPNLPASLSDGYFKKITD